jgi:hypothetical protein
MLTIVQTRPPQRDHCRAALFLGGKRKRASSRVSGNTSQLEGRCGALSASSKGGANTFNKILKVNRELQENIEKTAISLFLFGKANYNR